MKRTKVKVLNGGVRVEGKCYKAHLIGEEGSSSRNPLVEYNNHIITVKDSMAYNHEGHLIGQLHEVPSKFFQYYITAKA